MLPVYLEVPREAKKIINKNVGYMFELLKCTCEGVSYAEVLDSIYPSYILDIKLDMNFDYLFRSSYMPV